MRARTENTGESVEVVILTVIPAELEAAREVLQIGDGSRERDADGTVYFRGSVRSELAKRDYATLGELTEVFDGMVSNVQVFDEIWRSRTKDEQSTLQRLAQSDEPGDVNSAAIQLAREGYLERHGDKVAIVVPLFRDWIRMNII